MANAFEKQIGDTFESYRAAGVAELFFLFPPMRVVGMIGKMPAHIPCGKAPYDVSGYFIGSGVAIGAELKQTAEHENSLSIVGPEKKGSGLHYHQLQALLELHRAGGSAFLLWNNGGEIGLLDGARIAVVSVGYEASLKSKNPARGSRSIPWGMFAPVKVGVKDRPLWIPGLA
jgi:penicillin-binding protein-related factor A (putative recombinase)